MSKVHSTLRVQSGFSLIEVLVTMVVVGVGLLGVAALQAKSLQYAYASHQRTLAAIQANDLTERLWAGACAIGNDNPEVIANRNTIRDEWIATWQNDNRMPGWSGELQYDDTTTPPRYTITINWTDSRISLADGSTDANQSFVYQTAIPQLGGCAAAAS